MLYFVDCGRPLGLESKTNNAIRITSTTTNIGWNYGPSSARLNGPYAWCTTSNRGYLLINLGKTYKLTAIATQGETRFNSWVKKYRISFKSGETIVRYRESGSIKVRMFHVNSCKLRWPNTVLRALWLFS